GARRGRGRPLRPRHRHAPRARAAAAPASLAGTVLRGVVTTGGVDTALLVLPGDGAIRRLSPGQTLRGWRLVAVGPASAAFERNGETVRLTLQFKRGQAGGTGGAAAPAPGRPAEGRAQRPAQGPAQRPAQRPRAARAEQTVPY
ncbi:MAG: hypothetical protein AAF074_24670, partial [Pseudomonadota bacterium]